MDQPFFTISFEYEIVSGSLSVSLSAEIEMTGIDSCYVRNIRRLNSNESPLLPVLQLKKLAGTWVHADGDKESNISKTIGHAIEVYLKDSTKSRSEVKDR